MQTHYIPIGRIMQDKTYFITYIFPPNKRNIFLLAI